MPIRRTNKTGKAIAFPVDLEASPRFELGNQGFAANDILSYLLI